MLSFAACVGAAAVAASRIYLNYHTLRQVLVGVAAGAAYAVVYFVLTTVFRRSGWLDWSLDTTLARKARMRDLITVEDIQDAGWGRFESRRQAQRTSKNKSKKTR